MTLAQNLPPIIALALGLLAWVCVAWQRRRSKPQVRPVGSVKIVGGVAYRETAPSRVKSRMGASRAAIRYSGRAQMRQRSAGEQG